MTKVVMAAEIMPIILGIKKKKHDIQKFRECIRSDSEKRDRKNK